MESNRHKVLILIKHGLYEPFIDLAINGQGKSFLLNDHGPEIRVIHYYGIPVGSLVQKIGSYHEKIRWTNRWTNLMLRIIDHSFLSVFLFWIPRVEKSCHLGLNDDEYQCRVLDMLPMLRWKQLAIYKYVLENYDFEYILDTNESSYIDYKNLLREVAKFNQSPLYAGNVPAGNFISGANRFFDRRALEILVKRKMYWNPAYLEDVAIGRLMSRFKIPIVTTKSVSILRPEDLEQVSNSTIINNYHFRAKCVDSNGRRDHVTMIGLQKRFQLLREENDPL